MVEVRVGLIFGLLATLACIGAANAVTILGNSILRDSNYARLAGQRVAILSNPTGVFADNMVHIVDDLHRITSSSSLNPHNIQFCLIFGPEHGFRGEKQAETGDELLYYDSVTGLPVMSAYSMSTDQLQDAITQYNITSVVVDMQDVGVRLYTFIWTMYNVQFAFGKATNTNPTSQFVVCDRPNPNGGNFVDGPMLDMAFASGYGRAPIPFIHGMTIGELARYFNSLIPTPVNNLEVITMVNWHRDMSFEDTLVPWVPPSPNLPTLESARAYAATVLLEATTISEGRGTCTPFTLFGSPFINNPLAFANEMNIALNCVSPGEPACFRAAYFQPTFQKYNGTVVQGAQYIDRVSSSKGSTSKLSSFRSAIILLQTLKSQSTPIESFVWDGSWFGHPGVELIDQYAGTDLFREMFDQGSSVDDIVAAFEKDTNNFKDVTRRPYLLYK